LTALVSGSEGFIGRHLVGLLESLGSQVKGFDQGELDVRDNDHVRRLVEEVVPTEIYHLAAFTSPAKSWEQPYEAWDRNVRGTASLLEAVRTSHVRPRILVMSSISIFEGTSIVSPIKETDEPSPLSPYAASKLATENLTKNFSAAYGIDVKIVRPTNIIGPGQSTQFVVPSICNRIVQAANRGESLIEVRNGKSVRDFVDVRDAVNGLIAIMSDSNATSTTYNLCSGRGTSIRTISMNLARLAAPRVDLVFETGGKDDHGTTLVGCPDLLRTHTGWEPRIPMEATLTEVFETMNTL
jgi:nucleoside-diphosphate-sugar epimerase